MTDKMGAKRILLKLSGEFLLSVNGVNSVDKQACQNIAETIVELHNEGYEIGLVVGGGNIFRGKQATEFGFARTPSDHIGILATCINALVLEQLLSSMGVKTRIMSSRHIESIIEPYNWKQANLYLEKGVVVFFAGGTGNPYFTTDTAAALRAIEIQADLLVKATKVDGVYDKDPMQHTDAKMYQALSFDEALAKDLQVMDATALALCRDQNMPVLVANFLKKEKLFSAIRDCKGATIIKGSLS